MYLRSTELFEIELFWYLTELFWHLTFCDQNYTNTKLNCLKIDLALNDPKRVDTPWNQPINQPTYGIAGFFLIFQTTRHTKLKFNLFFENDL